jgi:hypothetical protein
MKTLVYLLLSLALTACAFSVAPQSPNVCSPPVTAQVVFPPGQEGILEVRQSTDDAGMLFQHGILYVATEAYVGNANNPSWPNGLVMAMNDQRQATTVWAGRGLWGS